MESMYPNPQKYNLKYWERMQTLLDAKETRAQSLRLRHKWIERQNTMNYQNEYDRLRGELSNIPPGLAKHAIEQMMPKGKLDLVTQYDFDQPKSTTIPKPMSKVTSKAQSPMFQSPQGSDVELEKRRRQWRLIPLRRNQKGGASSSSGSK